MQEHPIPRQITTFEFKLIGELTIKQFGFLAFGAAVSVMLFFLVPKFFYLNFLFAAVPAIFAIGFAFVPVNDRPMDIYVKNLIRRLFSPTQYFYRKNNSPPKILLGLELPPREVLLQYVKAQQSLNEYLEKKPKTEATDNVAQISKDLENKKQSLQALINSPSPISSPSPSPSPIGKVNYSQVELAKPIPVSQPPQPDINFQGVVTTSSGVPLANQMVYVKQNNETVRLFKTDINGAFQNNLPLSIGDYFIEVQDPQKKHEFARMKLDNNRQMLEIRANKWTKNQLRQSNQPLKNLSRYGE